MNEIDLYRKVVEDCDEALREAFIRRMNVAEKIAESKLKNGLDISNSEIDELHVKHITFGVPTGIKPMAVSLWRSLARMNRGRQYAYLINHSDEYKLSYDSALTDTNIEGPAACTANIAPAVLSKFGMESIICSSTKEVIRSIEEGINKTGVVKTNGFYDTGWLYSMILDKPVYVNRFEMLNNGGMLAQLSDKIVSSEDNTIITVAFSIVMTQKGDLAQKVSIFSEAGLNIEYLTVKTENIADDDSKDMNIVFTELSGGTLRDPEVRSAFLQMERECAFFRVLGCRNSVL